MTSEHICSEKDTLDEIKDLLAALKTEQGAIHKKLFESNGERALVEIIRENSEWRLKTQGMYRKAVALVIAATIGGQGLGRVLDFLLK